MHHEYLISVYPYLGVEQHPSGIKNSNPFFIHARPVLTLCCGCIASIKYISISLLFNILLNSTIKFSWACSFIFSNGPGNFFFACNCMIIYLTTWGVAPPHLHSSQGISYAIMLFYIINNLFCILRMTLFYIYLKFL